MATVKDMMDKAARACSLGTVPNWLSSTTATVTEMKDFLDETITEILERVDLPAPITKDTSIAGTGVETYDLPDDFLRLTRDAETVYEITTTRRAGIPINTNGEWTHLKQIGSAGGARYYRLSGDDDAGFSISFYRPLETGSSVTVSYVSKNWARGSSGTEKSVWNDLDDALLLPLELVRLGVVWRFRRRKGLAYADRVAEYEIKLSRHINDQRGIRKVDMAGQVYSGHPMRVPVPDFIPSS